MLGHWPILALGYRWLGRVLYGSLRSAAALHYQRVCGSKSCLGYGGQRLLDER